MKKLLVVLMFAVAAFSAPAAAEETINLNVNFDFSGIFGGDDKANDQEKENNTYGERVGGQSVHTETEPSTAEVGKNNDDFQITEDTSEKKGFLEKIFGPLGLF
ncbi:hypothetical protein ACK3SF_02445 [Candidatus Nanosalina sp. VS9-1]|uniref:hypothetical protein n=1 Tax=Candidatus Nanosalina sp. VS9-1 TaxID=3388566 RepID=UPI0039DF9620